MKRIIFLLLLSTGIICNAMSHNDPEGLAWSLQNARFNRWTVYLTGLHCDRKRKRSSHINPYVPYVTRQRTQYDASGIDHQEDFALV